MLVVRDSEAVSPSSKGAGAFAGRTTGRQGCRRSQECDLPRRHSTESKAQVIFCPDGGVRF